MMLIWQSAHIKKCLRGLEVAVSAIIRSVYAFTFSGKTVPISASCVSSPQSFAIFVASKKAASQTEEGASWNCCGQVFTEHSAIHKHVARTHSTEMQQLTHSSYQRLLIRVEEDDLQQQKERDVQPADSSTWMPDTSHISQEQLETYWSDWLTLVCVLVCDTLLFLLEVQVECCCITTTVGWMTHISSVPGREPCATGST